MNELSITPDGDVKPIHATPSVAEYIVPVDPMEDLQCDSCQ
ncbi:hypothetical protein BFL35_16535 (plasmid) [Clavibacter michiganensis]|nr:hypothetical protein BFL35_16535 [Clavibacter michiganensis]